MADETNVTITQRVSEFIVDSAPSPSESVIHQAKRCLIDWLGVAIAGSVTPGAKTLARVTAQSMPIGHAHILGSPRRGAPLQAALVNGFSAHVLDYDDTYNPGDTTVHGSAPVWPTVMAAAELSPTSGIEGLRAFIVGFETETRVALAAGPRHYEAGWHVTGTVGHLGAAAAASRVLRLTTDEVTQALGTAGTQAAGLKEVYGSMGKALHPGKASFDGLLSASLTRQGFTSTTTILDGDHGFLRVFSPEPAPRRVVDGLHQEWTLLDNGFKPYACGSLTHPCIEAVIAIRHRHGIDPGDIGEISVTAHPYVLSSTGIDTPTSGLEAKFSIYHCAAVAMLDGAARLEQFTDERVRSADVATLRQRVVARAEPSIPKDAVQVRVRTLSDEDFSFNVRHNKGTPGNPMSDDELEQKLLALAAPHIGDRQARALADASWHVDEFDDITAIMGLACGSESPRNDPASVGTTGAADRHPSKRRQP